MLSGSVLKFSYKSWLESAALAIVCVAVATAIRFTIDDFVGPSILRATPFYLAVLLASVVGHSEAGTYASLFSLLIFWLAVEPASVESQPLRWLDLTINASAFGFIVWSSYYLRERLLANARTLSKQFESSFEANSSGIVVTDSAGTMQYVDQALAKMFGYRLEELVGKPVEMLIPVRYQARHPAWRTDFAANPSTRPMGRRRKIFGLRKDGSEFEIQVGLSAFSAVGGLSPIAIVVDLTNGPKSADSRETLLAPLVEQIPIAIGIIDCDGNWIFRNSAMQRFFPSSIPSHSSAPDGRWLTYPGRQALNPAQCPTAGILQGQIVDHGIEFVFLEEDTREVFVRLTTSPYRTADGQITGAVIMIQPFEPK